MHTTIHCQITRHTYIFQIGAIVEVRKRVTEKKQGEADSGYLIADTGYGLPGSIPFDAVSPLNDFNPSGEAYYGKCLLTSVSNFSRNTGPNGQADIGTPGIVKPENVRVIHYPDCQQLVFHMPANARDARTFRITNRASGEAIEECLVGNRLNGSTMLLINTLPYPPGCYEIEADWPDGWTHQIRFIKFNEGFPKSGYSDPPPHVLRAIRGEELHLLPSFPEEPAPKPSVSSIRPKPHEGYVSPAGNVRMVQNDHEYRLYDSNGVEMDSGFDHEKLKQEVFARFTRRLEYTQDGRGGSIYYKEGELNIHFDWEFGGGNAVVIIYIPEVKHWEPRTGTPLSRRDEILTFLCEQVIRDQAPGCHSKIYSNSISILY